MAVSFAEFQKIDLRVGKVKKVEEIEGLDRIYKLEINIGEKKTRTILAGEKEHFKPSELLGKSVVVVANLERESGGGTLSEGMVWGAGVAGQPILLVPEEKVKPGTSIH